MSDEARMSSEMATPIEMMYDYEMMGLYDGCIAIVLVLLFTSSWKGERADGMVASNMGSGYGKQLSLTGCTIGV